MTTIYIDDTGLSGENIDSEYISPDTVSWAAIVMTAKERIEAEKQMGYCLDYLKKTHQANEFHFCDIYGGRKEFKNLSFENKQCIFEAFAKIFNDMKYPIFFQSFSKKDYEKNNINEVNKLDIDGFNMADPKHFALYHLLILIKKFIEEHKDIYPPPYEIIIDEGKQNNPKQKVNIFGDNLLNRELQYKNSKDTPLLQLVDFVAYTLNRYKMLSYKKEKSKKNIWFLEMASNANFNTINMKKKVISYDQMSEEYEKLLEEAYSKSSVLDKITLEEHIKESYPKK